MNINFLADLMKNRKGQDKMIAMYWFFIIFLVAAAVVYMVSLFYNHPIDVREMEANVLANKVADCISREGQFTSGFLTEGSFNAEFQERFFEICGVNFEVEKEFGAEEQYFVGIDVYGALNFDEVIYSTRQGNLNKVADCQIGSDEYEKISKCVKKRLYVLGGETQYLVQITTVVDKGEKNVKL